MQIDWLTVAAQIVNFLILVWLLQHFLYGPITGAMKRREERIEQRLSDARQKRSEAEDEAERFKKKQADLDARTEDILEEARKDAEDLRQERKKEIEDDAQAKRAALKERLNEEKEDALQDIRKRATASTFAAVRATLRDFAGADLGEELATRFASHLKDLPSDDLDRLTEAARKDGASAEVECGPDLSSPAKAKLTRAIHQSIAEGVEVQYVTNPDLLLGLRLSIAGQIVEWSAGRHLDRIEEDVREALTNAGGDAGDAQQDAA